MKKWFSILLTVFSFGIAMAQPDSAMADIARFQKDLNEEYKNPKTSPLKGKDLKRFKKHTFFDVDLEYRVIATLTVTPDAAFFPMKTSSQVLKDHRIYGTLKFELKGKTFEVPVYQSKNLMAMPQYKTHLFFPFTDLTTAKITYGAGRYIDLEIPKEGNTIILDFNKAYNPFCAYSDGYSCPLVPAENNLDIEILAGVKYVGKK
jgi:uncharacterized protein (DUF1684 family)